ncbi:MAG: RelA/SpoT family protein [Flavobacteriales bacterium]
MIQFTYSKDEGCELAKRYKEILSNTYITLSKEDKKLIHKAMKVAVDAHKNQRRRSGEPYIYHPIAVAKIVSQEIGLDATSITSALLHDVVEDSDYTLENIEYFFNRKIATIIDGLTKITVIKNQTVSKQAENYRKLLFTLSEDIRVILVKLADRLHNMRTMEFMPPEKQKTIASETLYIFAPIAHRLGLYDIKTELEDLSLKHIEPDAYHDILKKLEDSKEKREKYINEFIKKIKIYLDKEDLTYQIKGRTKSTFSIQQKMLTQDIPFENIYDIFAIRIIYQADAKNEKFIAWKIYSIISDLYYPNPKRLRDWISQPKSTNYESLHITVMGPQGRWVEVQIRSERMNEIAEKGIAAHYKYKHGFHQEENGLDDWLNKIREVLENDKTNTIDLIDNFKLNLYAKEIYVFTHKGDLISLPKGATALDFAYSIHSHIGDTCLGAKVNSKLVPLDHPLQSGDQIEIITSPNQKPKADWLDITTTSRARSKIRSVLKSERKKIAEEGKEILEKKLRHLKINLTESTVHSLINFFKERTSQEIFYKVGIGAIDNKELKQFANETTKGIYKILNRFSRRSRTPATEPKQEKTEKKSYLLVFNSNEEVLDYTLSNCCNPISGDRVFGFITINQGIKVHREDCANAVSLRANYEYRIINAKWIESSSLDFKVILQVNGFDRIGMIKDITEIITYNMHLNIKNMNVVTGGGLFQTRLTIQIKNKNQFEEVTHQLKNIEEVTDVKRIYQKNLSKYTTKNTNF